MTVTFIVPTIGRASLGRTLASIETRPGDEILVVGGQNPQCSDPRVRCIPCPSGGDWGHTERNYATPMATGDYIAHIDDDDIYVPGMRDLMTDAMRQAQGQPVLFKMMYPNGLTLWQDRQIRCGNVGTPMFLIPNVPEKLGTWQSFVGGDCAFLESSKWAADEYVWRDEVISLLGHNT